MSKRKSENNKDMDSSASKVSKKRLTVSSSGLLFSKQVLEKGLSDFPALTDAIIASKPRKAPLKDLDRWYMDANTSIESSEDVFKVVKWKLYQGTFRPGLQKKVESNEQSLIERVLKDTKSKLAAHGTMTVAMIMECIECLTQLKGVGPATASAILSKLDANGSVPFMSDEILACAGVSKPKYTIAEYRSVLTWTESQLSLLLQNSPHSMTPPASPASSGQQPWNRRLFERAVCSVTKRSQLAFTTSDSLQS